MGLAKLEAKPDRCSIPGGRNDNHPLRTTWKPTVPISYPDPPEVGSFFLQFEDYGHCWSFVVKLVF